MRRRLAVLAIALAGGAAAEPPAAPAVEDAWIRAAPPVARVLAGYLTVHAGARAIEIVGAACEGFGRTEIHETVLVDGVASMRALPSLPVSAGGSRRLAPGGLHLMLLEPQRVPAAGESIDCRLELAGGDVLAFSAEVRPGPPDEGHEHHHH